MVELAQTLVFGIALACSAFYVRNVIKSIAIRKEPGHCTDVVSMGAAICWALFYYLT